MGNISKIRVGGVTYPLNDSSVNEELRREVERAYTAEGEIKENILGIEARIDDLDNKINSGEGNKELEEKVSKIDSIVKENEKVTAYALNELKESINGIVDDIVTDIPIATSTVLGGIKATVVSDNITASMVGENYFDVVVDKRGKAFAALRLADQNNLGVVWVDSSVNPESNNPVSGKGVAGFVEDAIEQRIVYPMLTTVEIAPNVLYLWEEVESLDITLAEGKDNVINEYMFQFTSGATATTLVLPADIKWVSAPNIQANKVYQVSIINNLGVIGEFNNE